jgi:hypothetical protein
MKGNSKLSPAVRRFLELSTAHITSTDDALLSKEEQPFMLDKTFRGYYIHLDYDRAEYKQLLRRALKAGFSAAFLALVEHAHKHTFDGLIVDGDGPMYSDFPTFDW